MAVSSSGKSILPEYYSSLQYEKAKDRYMEKISCVGDRDLYEILRTKWSDSIELWPAITYIHIGMYLLLTPSPYSQEDLLKYKSLDGYRNFVAGWVREICAENNGKILCGHCDCMAGLGECCSHVASLLWAVECGVRHRESLTVTQRPAYWAIPSSVKYIHYAPVRQIDFLGKKASLTKVTADSTPNQPAASVPRYCC